MPTLTSPRENFPRWYQEVVEKADLAEHSPIKGAMTIKPYGYALWEAIQSILNEKIKQAGVANVYFPLFIPKSFLEKEAHHVAGFAPEVAWVTQGGTKDLEEPLAVRPTSETTIGEAFSRWIQSYRDLPLRLNQWANVVRWELRPRLFLRTTEFLWQEGHTCHATLEEAQVEMNRALKMYKDFINNYLAVYVVDGYKSESEKFAGAETTTTVEALMRDGKALQMGTSHNLGQNFAKVFNIQYLDTQGKKQFVHQTSWGVSTRLIGGLIMAHGDEKGLRLPPRLAPYQIVIIPIWQENSERKLIESYIKTLTSKLKSFRFYIDWDEQNTPGWKFNEWELKGVPLRIEIGQQEVKQHKITAVRRDSGEKIILANNNIQANIDKLLESIHNDLFLRHKKFTQERTFNVDNLSNFQKIISKDPGFLRSGWCGQLKCEKKVKETTQATLRVIPFNQSEERTCLVCGQASKKQALWAKAY